MKYIFYIIYIGLCIFCTQSVFGQIDLTLNGRQPYPVFAQNYIVESDVITARIKNNSTDDIYVKVYASISGPYGISLESSEPTCILTLDANLLQTFSKNNFDDLCVNLNFSDINYGNLSTEQRNGLIIGGILPEGEYSYCLSLRNALTNIELVENCLDFQISFPDRPEIISPQHESTINGNLSQSLNVAWNHIITDQTLRMSTNYNLKVVSIPNNGDEPPTISDATILLDDSGVSPFFYEYEVTSPQAIFIPDLAFVNGDYYAVRITATSDDFPYPVTQAQSNVVIFQFIEEDFECGSSFSTNAIYPAGNSIIPFKTIAPVIKFEPYCDSYARFKYKTNIKENGTVVKNTDRTLNWNKGPREFLERRTGMQDPDGYYSSHISTGDYNNLPTLMHGKNYSWDASGSMQLKSGKKFNYSLGETNFKHGMPKLKLTYPIDGQEISPGDIQFLAVHDDIPENPLPPYKVRQIIDNIDYEYTPLEVNELAVIQVSDSQDFDTIYYAGTDIINTWDTDYLTGENNRFYNFSTFIASVYKDISFNHNLSDTLTYYWRIGWADDVSIANRTDDLLNPLINPFYEVSDVGSFKIKSSSSSSTSEPEPTTAVNDPKCSNPCELTEIINTTDYASNIIADDEIKIGNFTMEVVEINKTGNTYTGEGLIKVPFIKDIISKVTFQNIKINTDKVVYEGNIAGKQGGNELENLSSILLGQTVELPFGWDTTLNQIHLTAGITDLNFTPTNAYMEMTLDLGDVLSNLIYESDNYPVMSASICITPGGFENDVYLYHQNTITLDENSSGYGFEFKGGNSLADTLNMTYVRWGCGGFKEMQLGGAVIFAQDLLIKDSGNLTNDAPVNERVKGHFAFKYKRADQDIMIAALMEEFQFTNYLKGWGFDSDTIFIDLSDLQNPPSFEVPDGYDLPYLQQPATANTWKGIYIPRCKVLSPKNFVNTNRSTMGLSTMILGDGIYHLRHKMYNVVNEGIIGRMTATVDTIDGVISNVDFSYRMSGKLRLPFIQEDAFLQYSGLYNSINDWNFLIKVGNDSLEVPIYMAYLKIYENSYISLAKEASNQPFRIKAMLNGHLSLDDGLKNSSYAAGFKKMTARVLAFEDMTYESGVGFTNPPKFRLASPEKSVNGFPIQLDSIAFVNHNGNPGLYLRPKLVMNGDANGFSAFLGMIFYSEISFSGSTDRFFNPDLYLSDIGIDAAFSGFTLNGYVKFLDSDTETGFEGKLDFTAPAGVSGKFKAKFANVRLNTTAAFNTPSYYNYWYVDALIGFGRNGVPVFSGVNMYGIGGGLWYNMRQDVGYKINPSLLYTENPTPPNTTSTSGIPYTKSFGSGYGFKIQGLFGDPEGGDKINMLLALEAQIPASGGPTFSLKGDFRMMSKITSYENDGSMSEDKKALWGRATIILNMQEDFISADFQMHAKISKNGLNIIKGSGPGFRMVNADFFAKTAGENFWYFYIGTPEDRGGVIASLGAKNLSSSAYAMMGHGVDPILPQPDDEFLLMLNAASSSYSANGDVQSILNVDKQLSAYGIAFGAVIKDSFRYDYTPFYMDIKAIFGFDFNVTKDGNRKCVETGITPGYEDWYATGQLYAGIKGDFGIHVDLWFIEGKYHLFNASIAALMSGGFPSPTWFYCKGTLQYRVLDWIEGSHSFEFVAGEKCTFGTGNPFGEMEIITDTYPKKGEVDVSVFTHPSVSYSLKVDRVLSYVDPQTNQTRQFKLLINQVSLKRTDDFNYNPTTSFLNDQYVSSHKPTEGYLMGERNHIFKIQVKAKEKLLGNGEWQYITSEETAEHWMEERTINFKTGPKPDSITQEQIEYTYPMDGQQFFLKAETNNNQGIIRLNNNDLEMFYTQKSGINYHYVVVFTTSDGSPPITELANVSDLQNITFNVDKLVNNKKYITKLMRKKGLFSTGPSYFNDTYAVNTTVSSSADFSQTSSGEYNFKILPAKFITLGNPGPSPSEKKLFQIYFKTSKYDNLNQKLNSMVWSSPRYKSATYNDIIHDATNPDESFDEFEIEGYISRPSSDPDNPLTSYDSQVISNKSLIRSGIFFNGIESFEENTFGYLGRDKVILNNHTSKYKIPNDFKSYLNTLSAGVRSQISVHINRLKLGITDEDAVNMTTQTYNYTLGPLSLAGLSSGILANNIDYGFAVEPTVPPPARRFSITVKYGTKYFMDQNVNKTAISSILEVIGTNLSQSNPTLYNAVSTYLNTAPAGKIWNCDATKLGIAYQFPYRDYKVTGTKKTKNYLTPGANCNADVD